MRQTSRRGLAAIICAVAVLWLGFARPTRAEPTVQGRVTENGKGVDGAEVYLLSPSFHLSPDPKPAARTRSGADGQFLLSAPEGNYLVIARASDRFAYFGRNPIRLDSRLTDLNLPLVGSRPVARGSAPDGDEGVFGRVLRAGQPVKGAVVTLYLDPSRGLRGPGYAASEPAGPDGSFQLRIPPGTYFVVARQRLKGGMTGALEPGDLFGVLDPFPLAVRPRESVRADLETVILPAREQMARFRGDFASLAGIIVDSKGTPLPHFRACLYDNPQMLDRPLMVSDPTGLDGVFAMQSVSPGSYFLGAREMLGGPPAPGERIGFLRGPEGPRVEVKAGARLDGLAVVVQVTP